MLASYAVGIVAIIGLMMLWIGVQGAWRKAFPAGSTEPDALAGRMGCHGCSHTDDCSHRPEGRTVAAKEEIS